MPAVIAALLAALSALVTTQAGRWVLSILLFLGIGFATKTAVVDPIVGYLVDGFAGLPSDIAAWVGFLNIDVYCSALASAYVAGAAKRVILRKLIP